MTSPNTVTKPERGASYSLAVHGEPPEGVEVLWPRCGVSKVLVMRTVDKNHRAYGGFQHPKEVGGVVEAPDFRDDESCGGGIHGLLWGAGNPCLLDWSDDSVWQVYEVDPDDGFVEQVDGGGKCKFRRGGLVFVGDRHGAAQFVGERAPGGTPVVLGTATAGEFGTATAGYRGTATAGYLGTATAGDRGTATAGNLGTATAGRLGTATAGDRGTATAGYRGTATAGYRGTATAGYRGTATAGRLGTATAGEFGTATAGEFGVLMILRYDPKAERYRYAIAEVDGEKIKPNTAYRLGVDGNFVKAEKDGAS